MLIFLVRIPSNTTKLDMDIVNFISPAFKGGQNYEQAAIK